jgi:hypothetical protein
VAVSNEPSGLLGRLAVDVPDGHLDPQIGKLAVIKKNIYTDPPPSSGSRSGRRISYLNSKYPEQIIKEKYAK